MAGLGLAELGFGRKSALTMLCSATGPEVRARDYFAPQLALGVSGVSHGGYLHDAVYGEHPWPARRLISRNSHWGLVFGRTRPGGWGRNLE